MLPVGDISARFIVRLRMASRGVPLKFSKVLMRSPQSDRNMSRITRLIFSRSCGLPTGPVCSAVSHGRSIAAPAEGSGRYRLLDETGRLLGWGLAETGRLQVKAVFAP